MHIEPSHHSLANSNFHHLLQEELIKFEYNEAERLDTIATQIGRDNELIRTNQIAIDETIDKRKTESLSDLEVTLIYQNIRHQKEQIIAANERITTIYLLKETFLPTKWQELPAKGSLNTNHVGRELPKNWIDKWNVIGEKDKGRATPRRFTADDLSEMTHNNLELLNAKKINAPPPQIEEAKASSSESIDWQKVGQIALTIIKSVAMMTLAVMGLIISSAMIVAGVLAVIFPITTPEGIALTVGGVALFLLATTVAIAAVAMPIVEWSIPSPSH